MEYYSAIKRNETGSFVQMWMDLENVIQGDRKKKEKQILYINAYMWTLEKRKWNFPSPSFFLLDGTP